MATEADICNLALSQIGEEPIQSISPPDPSKKAQLASRFYPLARNALLELFPWQFAVTRAPLALSTTVPPRSWAFAYNTPTDIINYLEVLDPNSIDDTVTGLGSFSTSFGPTTTAGINVQVTGDTGVATPQPFRVETDLVTKADVLFTNVASATLRYSRLVTDPTQFSPLFVSALSLLLGSYLAGAITKGAEGAKVASQKLQEFERWRAAAVESDANQQRQPTPLPATAQWLMRR